MICVKALHYLSVLKESTFEGLFCCKSLFGRIHEQFFQKYNDLRIQLVALEFLEQVPDYLLVEVVLTLYVEWKRSNNQRIGDDPQRVDVALLRVFFWILFVHAHYLRGNIPQSPTFVVDIILV